MIRTIALAAVGLALGASPAFAEPPLYGWWCVNEHGELAYGSRQPDSSIIRTGYGVDGVIRAQQIPGELVRKDCIGRGWVPATTG